MGGGETSKKGGINLDWNVLLRNMDDSEPPELVVVEKPNKRKSPEEESTEFMFQEFSDKQLSEAIERQNKMLAMPEKLRDGGEKLRLRVELQEREIQRRNSVKDNPKWENLSKCHDLKGLGAHDRNQERTPSQVNKVSKFAASFLKKSENQTENAFRNELSILNHGGHQKLVSSGHNLSTRRHTGSLPSRQKQFISPRNLSLRGDKCVLPKDEQKGGVSAISPPSCSKDRVAMKCTDKRNFSQAHASYDHRKHNNFVMVDLDEPEEEETVPEVDLDEPEEAEAVPEVDLDEPEEAETVPEVDQVDECMKDARIYYPSRDDAESVEICYSDLDCLRPKAFLTSTIINFYIRYLQQRRSSLTKQADNYHFFNTYFYEKLKEALQKKNDDKSSFYKIRRWWKGVKLFEKSYIFIPIHEQFHWSLIIICIPDKEEGMGPIILHLDSLGLHYSKLIFGNIRRLLIGEWDYMVKEDPYPCLPFLRRIQESFHESFEEKKIEVPQQTNEYDCGVFVLFFIQRFIESAPKRMKEEHLSMFGKQWFEPSETSRLRITTREILKDEFKKAKEHNCLLGAA